MELTIDDLAWYKRWFYKIMGVSLIPAIISAIGFAYIGIPQSLQLTIRHILPDIIREHMLWLFSSETWLLIILIISVVCLIWGGLGSHVTLALFKKKCEKLHKISKENESKSINTYQLFSNWLYTYSNHLNLTTDERISLYKLDMNLFSCVGRYSENEVFNTKPLRFYPRNQGCISRAWENGEVEETGAPDPIDNIENWVKYNVKNHGFTEDELYKIKMKSRSFYGIRLKSHLNVTIAVLLFESLNPNGLTFGKLKRLLNEQEKTNLAALIGSLSEHIPNLESARQEGF